MARKAVTVPSRRGSALLHPGQFNEGNYGIVAGDMVIVTDNLLTIMLYLPVQMTVLIRAV